MVMRMTPLIATPIGVAPLKLSFEVILRSVEVDYEQVRSFFFLFFFTLICVSLN